MSRLVDVATRLREVRDARRKFMDLWAMERSQQLIDGVMDDHGNSRNADAALHRFNSRLPMDD